VSPDTLPSPSGTFEAFSPFWSSDPINAVPGSIRLFENSSFFSLPSFLFDFSLFEPLTSHCFGALDWRVALFQMRDSLRLGFE